MDRRTFLEHCAKAVAAAALCGQRWPLTFGQTKNPLAVERPFEMLAIGDSVMWGQGLIEEHKFYTKVKRAIEHKISPRPVHLIIKAHSAATILPKHKFCPDVPGEVLSKTPTIYAQIELAVDEYERIGKDAVDLILVNGGINDFGVPRLVNFFTSEKTIIKQARKYCGEKMKEMLTTILKTFPNALVIVPGYYPIISTGTDPDTIRNLILAFLGLDKGVQVLNKADQMNNVSEQDWFLKRLAALSKLWYQETNKNLSWAVSEANRAMMNVRKGKGKRSANDARSISSGKSLVAARAIFVEVPFSEDEGYAAPQTCLWQVTGSAPGQQQLPTSIASLATNDEMYDARQPQCRDYEPNPVLRIACQLAGTGHPNVKGSTKYADAIIKQLQGVWDAWPRQTKNISPPPVLRDTNLPRPSLSLITKRKRCHQPGRLK